ncbi:hypothetical protein L3Q82_011380 [Scortum barcoo]|uniref:Uncharacterized protein n=1 Tax=Scortum barcoo TaxID=214431 RepID=A0ACB8WA85_9TELE|nr:hypothetical protein L3Q82_011380 [Scortum barcoo]
MRGRCNVVWVESWLGPRRPNPLDQNSGNKDMECHLAGGKEPELEGLDPPLLWTEHKGVHQCTWHQDTLGPEVDDRLCCRFI